MALGQWQLNQVHSVDCVVGLRGLPDNCIDIVVTSPAYWGQRGDEGIGCEADPRDYIANLTNIFSDVLRVLKPTGVLWLNIGDAYNTPINWKLEDRKYSTLGPDRSGLSPDNTAYTKNRGNRRAFVSKTEPWLRYGNLLALPYRIIIALCERGAYFRGEVIWVKKKAMPEGRCRRPHRKHESIYLLAKDEQHEFRTAPPVPSVWEIEIDMNYTPHTSTFPIDLPRRCIRASGITTGVVLDPFMGSGSTAIAAHEQGFDYIGFELDARRAEMARERIASHARQTSFDLNL